MPLQPQLLSNNADTEDLPDSDELDLHVSYRKPEVAKITEHDTDADLSDYVKVRLLVARLKALEKYKETWG